MKVRWTPRAIALLENARNYISRDNLHAAEQQAMRIQNAAARLQEFPWSGRKGRIAGTRELVIPRTPFLVLYRVDPEQITVLGVFHGARNWHQEH
jgi:toxin ParE1/3/4